ncbi:AAA family ATPase [Paraglaciecola polaris]|uniref:Transposon Tn7 transposition protein tnsC n=1 Tax=Paraglaciecola polaris LMG 21857 TaxID=1129793 RepID=K6ZN41_9ALTE|nr:AAA family ATPase [Paraglaciecola polaris]GAC31737.1 transposon Tn7 transposition protein tnsC [Paraglaciecola polaris LMG 21857]
MIYNKIVAVTANYIEQDLEEYKGNPLIEALPSIWLDDLSLAKRLSSRPLHSKDDLDLHPRLRLHAIARLLSGTFFHPLPSHLDLERKLSLMIRTGYLKRNPALNHDKVAIQENYLAMQGHRDDAKLFPTTDRSALGMTLIGCSGSGKTTAMKRVLSTYPQLIEHPDYNMLQQIPYVVVECPYDGELSSMCSNFFLEIDQIVGTDYHKRYSQGIRIGPKTQLKTMSQIALAHSVGLLVIDEIQHLNTSKSDSEELLNFFTTMTNVLGIPIFLIGTLKAKVLFADGLRGARRTIGFGNMEWGISKTEYDYLNWTRFIKRLWRFQWVKARTNEPSPEIIGHLFDLSQGILDIAVKLFVIAQIRAIVSRKEELSIPLFDTVYEEEVKNVHPMLDALRSGDSAQIAKFSDLTMPEVDVDTVVNSMPQDLPEEEISQQRDKPSDSQLELLLSLLDIDYKQHASQIVLLKEQHPDIDNKTLVKQLVTEIESSKSSYIKRKSLSKQTKSNVITPSHWHKLDHDDLRYIHSQSHTESEMHANLVKNGLIASIK